MEIVSVINYKGGVGKTSLTANLGAELAWRGKRVLLIDLDAQASLTFSFIKPDEWKSDFEDKGTIKAWFDAHSSGEQLDLSTLIHSPSKINAKVAGQNGKLEVIYSHLGLINVDLELATTLGGANLSQAKRNFISVHRRLSDGLSKLAAELKYDIVLIDCPPNFNIVTKTAIVASGHILVPTRPDELSTLGIDYLLRSIKSLVDDYNEYVAVDSSPKEDPIDPKILGVVYMMVQEYGNQPISAQRNYMARMRRQGDLPIFDAYIKRNDTLFAGAPEYGIPVVMESPSNESHKSVVAGLEKVTSEFAAKIGI